MRCMPRRSLFAGVAVALLYALAMATPTRALDTIGCERVWGKPSADNDLRACILDRDRWRTKAGTLVLPALSVILLAVAVLVLPWFLCCRSCCMHCIPTSRNSLARSRLWLCMYAIFTLLWSLAVCLLFIVGAVVLVRSAHEVTDSLDNTVSSYIIPTSQQVADLLKDPNNYAPSSLNFDVSSITDTTQQLRDFIHDASNLVFKYLSIVQGVLSALGPVLFVLCILVAVVASCRCAQCMPVLLGIIFWVLAIVFGVFSLILTFIMPYGYQLCDELKLQRDRTPGLLQFYAVPLCNNKIGVSDLRSTVHTQVRDGAQSGCKELLKYCDNTRTYDESKASVAFTCGRSLSPSVLCTSLEQLIDIINDTEVKDDLKTTLCNNDRPRDEQRCTLPTCANYCYDYPEANVFARNDSAKMMNTIKYINNITVAVKIFDSFVDCNFLFDVMTGPLVGVQTNPNAGEIGQATPQSCVELATSAIMIGVGCFVAVITCIVAFCTLQRGRVIWSDNIGSK